MCAGLQNILIKHLAERIQVAGSDLRHPTLGQRGCEFLELRESLPPALVVSGGVASNMAVRSGSPTNTPFMIAKPHAFIGCLQGGSGQGGAPLRHGGNLPPTQVGAARRVIYLVCDPLGMSPPPGYARTTA